MRGSALLAEREGAKKKVCRVRRYGQKIFQCEIFLIPRGLAKGLISDTSKLVLKNEFFENMLVLVIFVDLLVVKNKKNKTSISVLFC